MSEAQRTVTVKKSKLHECPFNDQPFSPSGRQDPGSIPLETAAATSYVRVA